MQTRFSISEKRLAYSRAEHRRKDSNAFVTETPLSSIGVPFFQRKREATMALRMITEKAMGLVAKQYQAALGASLAQTGEHLAHGF